MTDASAASALRALLANFSQHARLLRLTTALGADTLLVESLRGREALSSCFRFSLTVLCTDAHLDLGSLLGQPALLEILTQHSRSELRPLHGHITACERLGSDGGFARYRLTLEPWLALLRHRRDAYVWQGKNVTDIVDEIFGDYRGNGLLVPQWRFALADAYAPREVCTQFEESDLAFVDRLLAEEGLYYWFEHTGDHDSATLGTHTLVIADHPGAFAPNAQSTIRFHRAAAVERADSITAWHARRQWMTNAVTLRSWHESQVTLIEAELSTCHDNGDVPQLAAIDAPGARRFADRDAADRAARRQLEALEARNETYAGNSTVRTLAPGTTFVLDGHARHDAARTQGGDAAATFAVIDVEHEGRNNLTSDTRILIERVFGNSIAPATDEETPLYHNRFTALRADIPWRPLTLDGHGAILHPKPTAAGVQTAIVVGLPGHDLTTERDHRVKVQMHWQRGARGQGRQPHPHGDNAPGNEGAYIWVRVAEAAAGANWGAAFIPRIGQEVVIDYLDSDIDRPVIIGSLYNGTGLDDAAGNRSAQGAGPAIGNAPAWFAGQQGEHAHNAILAGFKTQEIGHSQSGQGGYNMLVFDDSSAQVGTRLHTTAHATQLNLGHIKRQQDNARQQSHGHGAELNTQAFGAVCAGQGMLISADARPHARSTQMDAQEAQAQLQQAHALQTSLADAARQHQAFAGASFEQARHEQADAALARPIESLKQTAQGTGSPEGGGAGTVPTFGRPDLVVSAPAGIALLTPQDTHAAAHALTLTGDIDISATAGGKLAAAVKDGIALFTYGDANAPRKSEGDKGIKLHAAHGKVDLQAQSAALKAAADKDVDIASTHARIEAAAATHVLLTAGGAYVKIGGGNIQIHAPGRVEFKAGMKELSGPASRQATLPALPKRDLMGKHSLRFAFEGADALVRDMDLLGKNYMIVDEEGIPLASGKISKDGRFKRIMLDEAKSLRLVVGDDKWEKQDIDISEVPDPGQSNPERTDEHGAQNDQSEKDPYLQRLGTNESDSLFLSTEEITQIFGKEV